MLYSDNNYNCIFLNNNSTFCIIRGTNINYRYTSCAGEPDFIIYQNIQSINDKDIYLFESPIDALSFISLNKDLKGKFISINGNMMINKMNNIENIKDISNLYICFDNDKAGDNMYNIIIEQKLLNISKIKRLRPIMKDYNEDLTNLMN